MELRLVKFLRHAPASDKSAGQTVGPLMVWAHQSLVMSALLCAYLRSAMAAYIVEASNHAILAANDDERIRINLKGKVIARPGNFTGMAGKKPSATPNFLEIGAID